MIRDGWEAPPADLECLELLKVSSSFGPDEHTSGHKDCGSPSDFVDSDKTAFGGNGTPKVIAAECGKAAGIR